MKLTKTALALSFFSLFAMPLLCQIVEEDLSISEDVIKRKYEEAVSKFNSLDQASSIYDFNEIIVILEAAFKDKTIDPSLISYLKHSYDFRAQIYFNDGDLAKSEGDILSIFDQDMDYEPPKEASVKYVRLFDKIKSKMTGFFSVITNPAGARVYLDEKQIGYSNTPVLRYKIGTYVLRVAYEGYQTEEKTIEINSGQTTKISIELKRTAAALSLQTSPAGVEVYLDGKYNGTTEGSAGEAEAARLKGLGLDAAKCSAAFKIPNLPLGRHKLELKKPCYQDSVITLDFPQPEDYSLNPVVLTTSQGEVILQDTPKEAEVFLNGQLQGKGSLSLKNLCSGPYTLTVKFKDGKYIKQFNLKKDETVYVSPSKKPTVLFGGLLKTGEDISYDSPLAVKTSALLETIHTLNVYTPTIRERNEDKELTTDLMRIGENLEGITIEPGIVLDPVTAKLKSDLLNKFDADLLLFLINTGEFEYSMILFHSAHGAPDVASFIYEDSADGAADLEKTMRKLDVVPEFQSPWLGLYPVEPVSGEGLLVIEVRDQSPAAKAGLSVGDRLLFLNARRMTDRRRYNEVLMQLKSGDDVSLKIDRRGSVMDLNIKVETAIKTPQQTYGIYYFNRALAEIISGKEADLLKDPDVTLPYLKAVLFYYMSAIEDGQKTLLSIKDKRSNAVDSGLIELFKSALALKAGDIQKAEAEREKYIKYPDSRLYDKNGLPLRLIEKYGIYP